MFSIFSPTGTKRVKIFFAISKLRQLKALGVTKEQALELKESIHKVFPKNYEEALSLDIIKNIHKFWQKYADEMGLIYKTNYSYLD